MPPAPEPEPEPKPDPEPEPRPEPATMLPFDAYSSQLQGDWTMWVKGLDGQCLETDGACIKMGENNRAWVYDYASDESIDSAYYHDYLGGSMDFEVDLSQVDCASASGIYLVASRDGDCDWDAKDGDSAPQCSRVEIMEANKLGFTTASYPCDFGVCSSTLNAKRNTDEQQYGPGADHTIDTTQPFSVSTRFFANKDAEGTVGDLAAIETVLKQGDRSVTLIQDDEDYLYVLTR